MFCVSFSMVPTDAALQGQYLEIVSECVYKGFKSLIAKLNGMLLSKYKVMPKYTGNKISTSC